MALSMAQSLTALAPKDAQALVAGMAKGDLIASGSRRLWGRSRRYHLTRIRIRTASIYPDAGLRTSYNNRLPATAALRESRLSCMGMRTS